MRFLADTNVVSELFRPRPDPKALDWADQVNTLALSAITVEELSYGFAWKPKAKLKARIDEFLALWEILPINERVARSAGEIHGSLQARGETRSPADMLVAATAKVHDLTVVTRNTRDFEGCGVPLLNPFS